MQQDRMQTYLCGAGLDDEEPLAQVSQGSVFLQLSGILSWTSIQMSQADKELRQMAQINVRHCQLNRETS